MSKKLIVLLLSLILLISFSITSFASINWRQFEGTEIRLLMNKHPFTTFIEPKIPEFEELTGIKVNMEVFPEDQFRDKRLIELNAGAKVDGFMIMPGQAKLHYWKAGWLAPIEGFIQDSELTEIEEWNVEDFFKGPMEGASIEGHQIGVVINAESSLLSYRKDLFDEYNVKVPETMEELEEAAKFFHGREVDGKEMVGIVMRGMKAAATSQFVGFLYSFGGSWLDEEGNANIASPESIAAFEFYGKLLREYGPIGPTMFHWAEATSTFMDGTSAMIYDANVFKSLYEDPQESRVVGKVGYTTIPEGPAGKIPHVSNWSLAVSGNASPEHQKATWLFIQWATNKENALGSLLAGVPAGRESAWTHPNFVETDTTPDWTAGSLESFEIGQPDWNPPVLNVSEIRDIVGEIIVDAIEGRDVKVSAENAARLMNQRMEK